MLQHTTFLLLLALLLAMPASAQHPPRQQQAGTSMYIPPDPTGEPDNTSYLYYPNKGQLFDSDGNQRPDLLYYTINTAPTVYFAKKTIAFTYAKRDTVEANPDSLFRIDLSFAGKGSTTTGPQALKKGPTTLNYYYEHLPHPVEGVQGYTRIAYPDVFPKVDMHFWANKVGAKSAFVVHPGGNASTVEMTFTGQDALTIDPYWLKLYLSGRELKIPQAMAFQVDQNENMIPLPWSPTFLNMGNGTVRFNVGPYDPTLKLVLQMSAPAPAAAPGADQPAWGTYIGHQGHDRVNDAVTRSNGDLYVVGETQSTFFPVTDGAFQSDAGGGSDIFVGAFNSDYGDDWITFIGGQQADFGEGITYNTFNDMIYITGRSNGALPVVDWPAAWNQHQSGLNNGSFVARLAPDGGALPGVVQWLAYFGGEGTRSTTITSDTNGNVFIAGWTDNENTTVTCIDTLVAELDFPACQEVNGQSFWQPNNAGGPRDGFIARFDALSHLEWSTFLGGDDDDMVTDLAVDNTNNVLYAVGYTNSAVADHFGSFTCFAQTNGDFPLCNQNGGYFRAALNGVLATPGNDEREGFIAKFSIDDTPDLLWSTYFGGVDDDGVTGVAVSDQGEVFVTGFTANTAYGDTPCDDIWESGFPQCASGGWLQPDFGGGTLDNFVAGFDSNNEITWSTFLGGDGDEGLETGGFVFPATWAETPSIALDDENNVYLVGTSRSGNATHPLEDEGYYFFQDDHADNPPNGQAGGSKTDAYLTAFAAGTHALAYSSYFGGTGGTAASGSGDVATAVAAHSNSRVYVVGGTNSTSNFPLYDPGNDAYFQGPTTVTAEVPDGFLAQLNPREWPLYREAITHNPENGPLQLYPNPTSGQLTVALSTDETIQSVTVYNAIGNVVLAPVQAPTGMTTSATIYLADLPVGLYMVRVRADRDAYISRVIVSE